MQRYTLMHRTTECDDKRDRERDREIDKVCTTIQLYYSTILMFKPAEGFTAPCLGKNPACACDSKYIYRNELHNYKFRTNSPGMESQTESPTSSTVPAGTSG